MTALQTFAHDHPLLLIVSVIVVACLAIILIVWALRDGREISFWPPRIGQRPVVQLADSGVGRSGPRPRTNASHARSEWQTEWRFNSGTHRETLLLEEVDDGTVIGKRITQSHKGSKTYDVIGYARGGWYWLEYHDPSSLGGGTMQLQAFTSGRLRGVITYPDCATGHHLCVANQWLLRGSEEQYDDAWRQKIADVYA